MSHPQKSAHQTQLLSEQSSRSTAVGIDVFIRAEISLVARLSKGGLCVRPLSACGAGAVILVTPALGSTWELVGLEGWGGGTYLILHWRAWPYIPVGGSPTSPCNRQRLAPQRKGHWYKLACPLSSSFPGISALHCKMNRLAPRPMALPMECKASLLFK